MSAWRVSTGGALTAAALVLFAASPTEAASHPHPASAAAPPADAAPQTKTLGSAGAWSAFASHDKTGRVCYLAGHPEKSEAGGMSRSGPMALVTHRPEENIANVVSFVEGYTLKNGSTVALDISGKKFDLFTNGDSAWAATSDLDRTIVETLAKGTSATVKGEPEKGRPTTDTYALAGFAKALALIDKACGVTRAGIAPAPAIHAHPRHPARKIVHKRHPQHS